MKKPIEKTNDQLKHQVIDLTKELNKLKEDYNQSHSIFGNSGGDIKDIVVWKMDEKGQYTYLSPNTEDVLGYKPEEMIGKLGLTYFRQEDLPQIQKKMEARIDGNREPSEFIMVAKDGSLIDMELYSVSIKDKNGNIVGFSGIARNISDRKHAEKKNRKNEKKLGDILNNMGAGVVVHAPDTSIIFTNNKATELLGLSEEQMRGKLAIDPDWHFVDDNNNPLSLSDYPVNQIISSKKSIKNMVTGVVRPKAKDTVWLLVNGFPVLTEKNEITEIIINFVDITDKKNAEEQIRTAQKFTNTALDAQQDTFFLFDPNSGKAIRWNKAFREISGYSDKEISVLPAPSTYYSPKDLEKAADLIQDVMKYGKGKIELSLICKNGSTVLMEYFVSTLYDEKSKLQYLISLGRDISERKKSEMELRESEEKFKSLVTKSEEIVYIIDKDGTFLLSEGKGLAKLGVQPGEVVGSSVYELYKDYPDMLDSMRKALDGETITFEAEVGDQYFRNWYTPQKNIMGETTGLFGLSVNITEQKLYEHNFNSEKQKLDDILEGTNAGTWNWNVQTGECEFNERWAEIMGYTLKELSPVDVSTWNKNVHPDDLPIANALLAKHFNNEFDYFDIEFRQPHKNGTWVWVNARGKVTQWTEDGKPLLMSGIHLDISDRKQAEIKLTQEKEFSEQMINALPGLFYQISTEGRFINWNKNFEAITGYSESEINKLSPIELFEGDDKKHIAERIQESFSLGNSDAYANLISKKGTSTPYYWTGKTIIINNEPFLIGMGVDISELKNIENELLKHHEHLEELVKERTKDLELRNNELDNAMKVFVGREQTIRDLQTKIRELKGIK